MLKVAEAIELTPIDIEAIRVAYSWLGEWWSPMEIRHAHHPNEVIITNGHSILFTLDTPPVPVPLSGMPRCAINEEHFQLQNCPPLDVTSGVVSHIWGGPRHNRAWHEATSMSWQVILEDLTPADEGLMVRLVRPADHRVTYLLYWWGPNPDLTEAILRLHRLGS